MTDASGDSQLRQVRKRLRHLTRNCRADMHEPDTQGVRLVKTRGRKLDNAYGTGPTRGGQYDERCFLLRNDDLDEEEWFNLADILALARASRL